MIAAEKQITVQRGSPRDLIEIPMFIGPTFGNSGQSSLSRIIGQLDTGNDHTAVRRSLLEEAGVVISDKTILLQGVTGCEMAASATVEIVMHFDNGEQCRIHNHEVVAATNLTCDALIGRDFLRMFDVHITRDGMARLVYE